MYAKHFATIHRKVIQLNAVMWKIPVAVHHSRSRVVVPPPKKPPQLVPISQQLFVQLPTFLSPVRARLRRDTDSVLHIPSHSDRPPLCKMASTSPRRSGSGPPPSCRLVLYRHIGSLI